MSGQITFQELVEKHGEIGAMKFLEVMENAVRLTQVYLEPQQRLDLVWAAMGREDRKAA